MSVTHRYELKYASLPQISNELDHLWEQIQQPDSQLREQAEKLGITSQSLDDLRNLKREDAISVDQQGAGLAVETTALVVSFAPVMAKITLDLWKNVFLPWLKRKYGADSFAERD